MREMAKQIDLSSDKQMLRCHKAERELKNAIRATSVTGVVCGASLVMRLSPLSAQSAVDLGFASRHSALT